MVRKRRLGWLVCVCAAALGTGAVAQQRRAEVAAQAALENVQSVEQRLLRMSEEISGAQSELGATKKRIAELEQDRQKQAREIEKLKEELTRCHEQRKQQEQQLEEARQQVAATERQVREREQEVELERQARAQQTRAFEQHVEALSRSLAEVRDAHLRDASQLEEKLTRGHESLSRVLATFASATQDSHQNAPRRSRCTPSRRAVVSSPATMEAQGSGEKKIND